jgi:hypothetical protein
MEDQQITIKQKEKEIRDEKKEIEKIHEEMKKQQQQLEKAKKEKEDVEDGRVAAVEKWKALNLENQKLLIEMEELQKSYHQSTIEVDDEYRIKFDEKLKEEEKYKQLQQNENDKKKLENIYNLNIQQRENEKQKIQQQYNLLVIEIEKQKNLSTINQTEIVNKSILLDDLKKQYITSQNQNIQNQIAQKKKKNENFDDKYKRKREERKGKRKRRRWRRWRRRWK